jgi:hypothetical protein
VRPDAVRQYLAVTQAEGAVLVQGSDDQRGFSHFIANLKGMLRARGVVWLQGFESSVEILSMDAMGVRGARLDLGSAAGAWSCVEPIERLDEAIPRHWHIELNCTLQAAAAVAALLARMDRVFCLSLHHQRCEVRREHERALSWWLDMGNAYLKLAPCATKSLAGVCLRKVAASARDRIVLGTGAADLHAAFAWPPLPLEVETTAAANAESLYKFPREN